MRAKILAIAAAIFSLILFSAMPAHAQGPFFTTCNTVNTNNTLSCPLPPGSVLINADSAEQASAPGSAVFSAGVARCTTFAHSGTFSYCGQLTGDGQRMAEYFPYDPTFTSVDVSYWILFDSNSLFANSDFMLLQLTPTTPYQNCQAPLWDGTTFVTNTASSLSEGEYLWGTGPISGGCHGVAFYQNSYLLNFSPGQSFVRASWHHLEFYVTPNTTVTTPEPPSSGVGNCTSPTSAPGCANGLFKVWLDGVLVTHVPFADINSTGKLPGTGFSVGMGLNVITSFNSTPTSCCGPTRCVTWSSSGGGTCPGTQPGTGAPKPFFTYIDDLFAVAFNSSGGGGSGNVTLVPTSFVFAPTGSGASSSAEQFTLQNTTSSSVSTSISISGANASQFSETTTCGSSLASGASCTISVTFSPTSVATDSATLNAGGQTASLAGSVPAAGFSPSSLAFGNVNVGASSALSLTLTNTGTGNLTVTGSSTVAPFSVSPGATCSTIPAGQTCTFTVTFQPTASGAASQNLTVTFGGGVATSTIGLTGTGVTIPVTQIPQIPNPFWTVLRAFLSGGFPGI